MSPKPRDYLEGCESSFLGLKQKNFGSVSYRTFPLRCHSWDCPVCARIKSKIYKERMTGLFDGRALWMYTFTFYHSRPPLEVWRDFSVAWNRLRTAATKKYGGISYARILEHHHKSPYPHLHVIADVNLGDVWLAAELATAGFGYQAKKESVTSNQAATYVAKYLTKPWTDDGCRQIRKNLRLRIVSFGGDACRRVSTKSAWVLISRDCDYHALSDRMATERTWDHGFDARLISSRIFDGFLEEIYCIESELLSVEYRNEQPLPTG
jgi:hypothetical protein